MYMTTGACLTSPLTPPPPGALFGPILMSFQVWMCPSYVHVFSDFYFVQLATEPHGDPMTQNHKSGGRGPWKNGYLKGGVPLEPSLLLISSYGHVLFDFPNSSSPCHWAPHQPPPTVLTVLCLVPYSCPDVSCHVLMCPVMSWCSKGGGVYLSI